MAPVWLNRAAHQRAHEGCHASAGVWNATIDWLRSEWAAGRRPTRHEVAGFASGLNGPDVPLHAHTIREVGFDVADAVATSRRNRRNGLPVRAPWRTKRYRPLSFTRNYGWRVTADGKLGLSFGRGHDRILLPLPEVTDSDPGVLVPPSDWGEIRLCWDRQQRAWSLHIAYATDRVGLPQAEPDTFGCHPDSTVTVAVDEGVINPMTLATVRADGSVESLVINGREGRAIKQGRNKRNASLQRALSKCVVGSRKHKRLARAKKRLTAKTERRLRNFDHHVSRRAADFITEQAVDTATGEVRPVRLVVGDVRGIEKNTNKKRRVNGSTRQQLSQWSRGRQERYLSEKTGLRIDYIPEPHTSQTCPACGTRKKPRGRVYTCKNCHVTINRDVVGAGNILSRAVNGGPLSPWINHNTSVVVKYQRAIPTWTSVQSEQHATYQQVRGRAGKPAVAAPNQARNGNAPVAEGSRREHVTTTRQGRGRGPIVVPTTQLSA